MKSYWLSWLLTSFIKLGILSLMLSLVIGAVIFYGSKFFSYERILKNFSNLVIVKFILLGGIILSFFLFCFSFWLYILNLGFLTNNVIYSNSSNYCYDLLLSEWWCQYLSIDLYGFIFLVLVYIVGILSFLALDTRLHWTNARFIFTCHFLVLVTVFFTLVNDVLIFFLLYEGLLLPSFLFVFYVSPYRRSTQAALYFLIWTQLGSLLVLCFVVYIIYITGSTNFTIIKSFNLTLDEVWFLYYLLFFGFGFKIPVWPFHHWLTKTHVEAPTGFSMFLSGFLVKSAVYGFYKLSNILGGNLESIFCSIFCYLGVLDASFKMWGQTDLKKLVAYGTVQEMSLIYLTLCWGDGTAFLGGVIFCIAHAFLSCLFFYLVDCLYRRYQTRTVVSLFGVLHSTPNLGLGVLFGVILYAGLPGTLKFICEMYIFLGLVDASPLTCIILLYGANFFGLIGFAKCWFNVVFGMSIETINYLAIDLTKKEILIISFCQFVLIFFSLFITVLI